MDCVNCNLTEICSVASVVKQHALTMTISVTNCSFNKQEQLRQHVAPLNPVEEHVYKVAEKALRTYKDFNVKHQSPDIRIDTVSEFTSEKVFETVPCPNCGASTPPDDIRACDGKDCVKTVCSNCATESERKNYCESCWDNL